METPGGPAGRNGVKAFSVLYHDVVAGGDFGRSGFAGPEARIYKLDEKQFAAHLDQIAGAVSTPPAEAPEFLSASAPASSWLLHFDDGGISALETIVPLLNRRGWRGHFHIPTDFIGRPGFLDREQVRELRRQGHVIGSHSCSHPKRISQLGWDELVTEWRRSRETLSEILGEEVVVGSVPGGFYTPRVARAAHAAGLRILFNSEPWATPRRVNGCLVLGRYSVVAATDAATVGGLVAGRVWPRASQYLGWNLKKAAKVLCGGGYARLRSHLLRRKSP